MSELVNILSAGEIEKGMFITGYESIEEKPKKPFNIFDAYSLNKDLDDEEDNSLFLNKNPWFKGYSFEVVSIAGPIIVVKTYSAIINGVKLAPVLMFDSRNTHFIQVSEEYHRGFWETLGIDLNKFKPINKTLEYPSYDSPVKNK